MSSGKKRSIKVRFTVTYLSRYDQVPFWIFSLKMCSSPISTNDICSLCEVVRAFLHQRDIIRIFVYYAPFASQSSSEVSVDINFGNVYSILGLYCYIHHNSHLVHNLIFTITWYIIMHVILYPYTLFENTKHVIYLRYCISIIWEILDTFKRVVNNVPAMSSYTPLLSVYTRCIL